MQERRVGSIGRGASGTRRYSTKKPVSESESQPRTQEKQTKEGFQRQRNLVGVFTPTSAVLFVAVGVSLYFYFNHAKAQHIEEREKARAASSYGRPTLGGPFKLTTHTGEEFTQDGMLGKWSLVYFGFTNCPDICPMELDKVGVVLEKIEKEFGKIFLPLFISVDPSRDPPSRLSLYLKDFHPSFVGLTGSYADIKSICKSYRVYFSTPPNTLEGDDYLVDHSIFVYLMDPEGKFVEAFGQSVTREEMEVKIGEVVRGWEAERGNKT